MALPQIISRNQTQRIQSFDLNERKVLSGGTDGDFYTVPTGKKAIITGRAVCTGLGAAASVELEANAISFQQWTATAGNNEINADPKTINIFVDFEISLAAGQILRYTQNTGTNGEMNVFAKIQETPA